MNTSQLESLASIHENHWCEESPKFQALKMPLHSRIKQGDIPIAKGVPGIIHQRTVP